MTDIAIRVAAACAFGHTADRWYHPISKSDLTAGNGAGH